VGLSEYRTEQEEKSGDKAKKRKKLLRTLLADTLSAAARGKEKVRSRRGKRGDRQGSRL